MSRQLGVEMTVLRSSDRMILMRGMILRRLQSGAVLTRTQLDVGIGQDLLEIRKRFSTFDFEDYVGLSLDEFYDDMESAKLVSTHQDDDDKAYMRGPLADNFSNELDDELEWLIDELPMSTRGFFDQLKQDPTKRVTVDVNDVIDKSKHIVEDTRDPQSDPNGGQVRSGPIIRH